jgi:hypothetical protein
MVKKAIVIAAFLAIFLTNVLPIEVGDFWWHLATGKWIVENGELPEQDPFSYTSGELRDDKALILKGYWFAQVLLYIFYKHTGFLGIIIARALLFTSISYLLYRLLRYYGLGLRPSLFLVFLILPGVGSYIEARPIVISFFMSLALFFVLERLRTEENAEKNWRLLALPPAIMLIWANMHGGYILGIGIMGLFLATEGLSIFSKGIEKKHMIIAGVLLLSILLSGANPNGYGYLTRINPLEWVISQEGARMASVASTHEFFNPLKFYKLTGDWIYFFTLCVIITLTPVAFLLNAKRVKLFHLSLAVILSLAALGSFRFGIFLFIFGTVFIGHNLASFLSPPLSKRTVYIASTVTAIAMLAVLTGIIPRIGTGLEEGVMPNEAIRFIKKSGLPEELFAPYEWGGYMIWFMYPEYRTFVDGRTMDDDVYLQYNKAKKGGYEAEEILRSYNVNTVLTFGIKPHSRIVPELTFHLIESNEWSPVYWDSKGLVFVRAGMAEKPLSKQTVWKVLISLAQGMIMQRPNDPNAHALLGEIYYRKGLRSYAMESFRQALALDPKNPKATWHMQILMYR